MPFKPSAFPRIIFPRKRMYKGRMPGQSSTLEVRSQRPARAQRGRAVRSLPRRASGDLFQGLQGLRTIHAGAPYEVNRRGVDLVDERVDAQAAGQLFVFLKQSAGLLGGLKCQPSRVVGRNSGGLQVGRSEERRVGKGG